MNTTRNIITLAAGLAWAGFAVTSATPASAYAIYGTSPLSVSYGTCSSSYTAYPPTEYCYGDYIVSYIQTIRFVSTACNAGGGCSSTGSVWVSSVYPTGRKTVSPLPACFDGVKHWYIYGLGTCAC
jgi:hypothetical protein